MRRGLHAVRSRCAAVALAFMLLGSDGLPAQTRWKAVAVSRTLPQFNLYTWLGEELRKRTNGEMTLDVVSLPELGFTGFEIVRVTRAGLLDITDVLPSYVAGDIPLIEGIDLPGLYPDFDTSVRAHQAFIPALRKYEDRLGGVVIGAYLWPYQVVFSKRPVREPADFRGLKVRVFGTALTEFVRALGAEPVSVPFAEVYTALERGTVDAAFTGSYSGLMLRWHEVSGYLVDLNIGPVFGIVAVSKRSWDRLSPGQRAIVSQLGEELTERGWEAGHRTTVDGIQGSIDQGMEWIPITPAMNAAVREVVTRTIVPSWVRRAGPGASAIFNEYIARYAGFTVP